MRGRVLLSLGLLVAAPRVAEACDYAPGIWGSVPGDTETLPANAAVFLLGADAVIDDFVATVDGVPATVVPVPELSQPGTFGDTAVRVEPAPQPGQTLVLEGTGCPPEWDCPLSTFTFTIVDPDDTAPAAVSGLGFDVFDHAEDWGDDCGGPSGDVSYWLHFDDGPGDEEPVRKAHRIEVLASDDLDGAPVQSNVLYGDGNDGVRDLRILLKDAELGGRPVGEAFCFRITTLDASGNDAGAPRTVCDPCHVRVDPEATDAWSEPEWTDADIYPGGVCAVGGTGGGSTGGGTDTDGGPGSGSDTAGQLAGRGGCGCVTVPAGSPALLGLPLLLLVTGRRRGRAWIGRWPGP